MWLLHATTAEKALFPVKEIDQLAGHNKSAPSSRQWWHDKEAPSAQLRQGKTP
jgi:hypothetical protein